MGASSATWHGTPAAVQICARRDSAMSFWPNMRLTLDSLMPMRSASVLYVMPAARNSARKTWTTSSGELMGCLVGGERTV